jgi:hypothetical protein
MLKARLLFSGVSAFCVAAIVACHTGAGQNDGSGDSSVSSSYEGQFENRLETKQPVVKAPEAIQPNLFVCKARRLDVDPEKSYYGTGKTRVSACDDARRICASLTGAQTAAVGGDGACVTGPSFDAVQSGIGQTEDEGGLVQGNGAKWICLAEEFPASGVIETRKWAGLGKNINQAYESAIKLCESRGGLSCARSGACFDTSNASVLAN